MKIQAPNYTQSPNILFDEVFRTLKEGELRIILVLIRQTFGWHKSHDRISLSFLEEKTGMDRKAVCRSLNSLIEKKLIEKKKFGTIGKERCYYSIITQDIEEEVVKEDDGIETEEEMMLISNSLYQCPKDTPPVSKGHPPQCPKDTHKRKSSKEIIDCSESSPPEAAKTNVKFISIKDFEGKETSLSREGLFSLSVQNRADWKENEIGHLWEILESFGNPIRDLYKFCNTTILNLRKSKISEKIIQREQKCQKTTKMETNISVRYPKEKLPNTNEETSGKGMSEHPLANCNQMTPQSMQYNVLRRSVRI